VESDSSLSPVVPQYRKRRRYGQSVIITWPRERLIRMDKNFRERMERAISLGLERRSDGEPVRAA